MKSFLLAFMLFGAFLFAATDLGPMYDNYFALQTSLAKDSLKDAGAAAKKLQISIPEQGDDQKMNEQLAAIRRLAAVITTAKTLDEARKPFEEISVQMIALKPKSSVQASEYYCPMVQKSWLQKGDKVQNPYLGKSMQQCGEKKK